MTDRTDAPAALLWLRRDLRRSDHPALAAAARHGRVIPVFVIDPAFWEPAGPVRLGWLAATLQATIRAYDGHLTLRVGDPATVIPALAAEVGAGSVHVCAESEPGGRARDALTRDALAAQDVAWVETGSPYAVTPGRIVTRQGGPFRVFTPFARAWREHGWPQPCEEPADLVLGRASDDPRAPAMLAEALAACPIPLPEPGEPGAAAAWSRFLSDRVGRYDTLRDRPDLDATSRLSPYLKFGVVHPRTLLADLAQQPAGEGVQRFVTELAWREFYADVLAQHPSSLEGDLRPDLGGLAYDEPGAGFEAWRTGRTGFPLVDAGMRQLLEQGWMHNRVRMVTASFLTKDLHHWWPLGARHFLDHLIDGDLASNAHGWQWVAGTGTDPSPYFRVFNPVTQADAVDPNGDYVRRFLPELRHLAGAAALRPWEAPDGYTHGYPRRIVDHAEERRVALERYRLARNRP